MNLKPTTGRNGTGTKGAENESAHGWPGLRRFIQRRPARHARLLLLRTLLAVAVLLPGILAAQSSTTNSPHQGNRYLVIVETSRAMKDRGAGVLSALQNLLASGMQGQMRRGDTVGLWTFSDQVNVGQFPLQTWSPEAAKGVTGRVIRFLQDQQCENPARFDVVTPALQRVVKHSEYVTVIIFSSGEEKIRGTPFDAEINKAYKTWRVQQQQAHMPFITVLRAEKGTFAERTVVPAPWKLQMPERPPGIAVVEAEPAKDVDKAKAAPPRMLPPLIVSGRKPKPAATNSLDSNTVSLAASPAPAPVKSQALGFVLPPDAPDNRLAVASPATSAQPLPPPAPGPVNVTAARATIAETHALESTAVQNDQKFAAEAKPGPAVTPPPVPLEASPALAPTPAPAVAVVAPASNASGREDWFGRLIWVAAFGVAGVGLGMFLMRRSRVRPVVQGSLITRSFEHK